MRLGNILLLVFLQILGISLTALGSEGERSFDNFPKTESDSTNRTRKVLEPTMPSTYTIDSTKQANEKSNSIKEDVFLLVEQMPQFPGGQEKLNQLINENIVYPKEAIDHNIEGKVYVSFTINSKGEIVDPMIMRGLGYGCDEEVLRIIQVLPKFIPGRQNGKPVSVRYHLPIKFTYPKKPKNKK